MASALHFPVYLDTTIVQMTLSPDRMVMLQHLLEERIAILDGAMATRIQAYTLSEAHYRGAEFRNHDAPVMGNYELLSITQPDLIRSIHLEYLEAGADIITTNTFRANLLSMGGYGLAENVYAVNLAAARLASSVRDRVEKAVPNWPRFVAGAVSAPDAPAEAYTEQVLGLLDGGVDVLLLETVFNTRNAIAVLDAFDQCFSSRGHRMPVVISATINAAGALPSGETIGDFWQSVAEHGVFAVGINCSLGPSVMESHLEQLSKVATSFVTCHPSAGLPGPGGQYPDTPDRIALALAQFAERGWLNVAGGCCGTGPEHVRRIREELWEKTPRKRP